ncbi:hypothetical protein GCM10011533_34440 [Streptosporangium jomthongense]|uniref:DUF4148 domain-containing protein n=1 Tax=Marinobacter aromaticivorans TaxID=1494078 RepID=A0ABW2J003_9GAMM|nr:hypothetical protein [Marinobacter aromaticivorans]GGE79229.1 hypothetical protein GCM10011533_34440 [Streptosporangium jomthongense]
MKKSILFLAVVTFSTAAFAGNIPESRSGNPIHDNMKSMQKNMNSMHNGMNIETTQTDILKNKDMQRLHKRMTLDGMSESGMEARLDMMEKKGIAYHRVLEKKENSTPR